MERAAADGTGGGLGVEAITVKFIGEAAVLLTKRLGPGGSWEFAKFPAGRGWTRLSSLGSSRDLRCAFHIPSSGTR